MCFAPSTLTFQALGAKHVLNPRTKKFKNPLWCMMYDCLSEPSLIRMTIVAKEFDALTDLQANHKL